MRLDIISFTGQGKKTAGKIEENYKHIDEVKHCHRPEEGVMKWAETHFTGRNALIFVGACGIAVRAVAPLVKDKLTDSAVIVIDEKAEFVIPILSGHVGGANELAVELAELLHAVPVITTATDINHRFAVDVFAKKNHLKILNKEGIKVISGKVLSGDPVSVCIEGYEEDENIPKELTMVPYPPKEKVDIVISKNPKELEKGILRLRPAEYVLGIGCRKGKTQEELRRFVEKTFSEIGVSWQDFFAVASIDKKKDEKGIVELAQDENVEFQTFTAEELLLVKGDFEHSSFVEKTVGVDNVCERAAIACCKEEGRIIMRKKAEEGKTIAIAKRDCQISWKGWTKDET